MTNSRLILADRVHTLAPVAAGPLPNALLLQDGRVLAVGTADEIVPAAGSAERIDLTGCTITPGLTDAHIHVLEWALTRRELDLDPCGSPQEVAARVANASPAAGAGNWIRGRGWNPHRWGGEYPDRRTLDAAAPERPVALQSHDMHAIWANSRALELAGIDAGTPDPDGGRIVRDGAGQPTGVLLDMAAQLIARRLPAPSLAEAEAALRDAQRELHALGITGVHAFPSVHVPQPESLPVLQALAQRGELRLRVLHYIPLDGLDDAIRLGMRSGFGDEWLRIGGVKLFLDGALGSRTAWMREPYVGSQDTGVRAMQPEAFRAAVTAAARAGISTAVHAIGDAAVDLALDVLSDPGLTRANLPHRIEHLQLCAPERFADPARAGIVCSMQPAHILTDWAAAEAHWGHGRCRGAYAFASLLAGQGGQALEADAATRRHRDAASGAEYAASPRPEGPASAVWPHGGRRAILAFGSDAPVEPIDPRLGFYAATTRQDLQGAPEGGWFPEERLDMAQVLAAYTIGPAFAAGDARLGRLVPGAFADLVAWERDPLATAGADLLRLRCVATAVGGEIV